MVLQQQNNVTCSMMNGMPQKIINGKLDIQSFRLQTQLYNVAKQLVVIGSDDGCLAKKDNGRGDRKRKRAVVRFHVDDDDDDDDENDRM